MDALERGVAHFNAGRFGPALACFRRARGPEAACFAAHALAGLGRIEEAAAVLARAARAFPGHGPAYQALAALARSNPAAAGVARTLDRVVEALGRAPRGPRRAWLVELVRAQAHHALGRGCDAEALSRWRVVRRLSPGDAEAARHLELAARKNPAPAAAKPAARPPRSSSPAPARKAPAEPAGLDELRALLDRPGSLAAGKTFAEGLAALEAAARRARGSPLEAACAAYAAEDFRRLLRLLPAAAREAGTSPRARVAAALYETLARPAEAARLLVPLAARRPAWAIEAARVAEAAGLYAESARLWETAARRGSFDAAAQRARLALWRGDAAAARASIRRLGAGNPSRGRLEALAAAVEGAGGALALLERELARAPDDAELRVWRCELLRRAGRAAAARREAEAVLAREPFLLPAMLKRAHSLLDEGRALAWQVRLALQLLGHPPPRPEDPGAAALERARCESALASFGGNRTAASTIVSGGVLERLRLPNPREPMQALQLQVAFEPPGSVLAEFGRRVAGAREPLERARWRVHRGELRLWLGDYAAALDDIEAGFGHADLKWPPIGAAGASMLLGRLAEAQKLLARGAARGASERVWLGWRGELRRLQGRTDEAVADLERCLGPASGPYIPLNLGLAALDAKKPARARALLAGLVSSCWAFAAAAIVRAGAGSARSVDELPESSLRPALEAGLSLLRGNRSHTLVTWLPADGAVRVARLFQRP